MNTVYCLIFDMKKFHCFTSLSWFLKKLLRLPTFTSFHSIHVQKFAKNFHVCEVIYEKCETFLPQTISNIRYTTNSLSIPPVLQLYHCKIVKHIFDIDSDNDIVTWWIHSYHILYGKTFEGKLLWQCFNYLLKFCSVSTLYATGSTKTLHVCLHLPVLQEIPLWNIKPEKNSLVLVLVTFV